MTGAVDTVDAYLSHAVSGAFKLVTSLQRKADAKVFAPWASKISLGNQEVADVLLSLSGEIALAATTPNPKIRDIKKWAPVVRIPELIFGFVAMNRDYFRIAYFEVVAKYQQKIEEHFGLEPGSLDKLAENGRRMHDNIEKMRHANTRPGKKIASTIEYFDGIYGEGKEHDAYWNDTTETYVLSRFLLDNKMEAQVPKVFSEEMSTRILQKTMNQVTDKTMLVKGLSILTSGRISYKGATTAAEQVKGAALMLAGAELGFVLPGGRRWKNPIQENPEVSRRGFLAHLMHPQQLLQTAIEHVETKQEAVPAFQLVGAANMLDVALNTHAAFHDKSRRVESVGKFFMYTAFATAAKVRANIAQRDIAWSEFVSGKDVSAERLGL